MVIHSGPLTLWVPLSPFWISLGISGPVWVPPALLWDSMGFPGLFKAPLNYSNLFFALWAILASSGLLWRLLGPSGLSWALLGSSGFSWALLGSSYREP